MVAKMTPEQIAQSGTEAAHQTALFAWASVKSIQYPELKWMHHIPNGGSRGDSTRSRAIAGSRLKAQGVKKGVPDICLPARRVQYSGLYIELKKLTEKPVREKSKGGLSDEQLEFRDFVSSQGFLWHVCYGWSEAVEKIESYLTLGK